jgi:hypothetical protein
MMIIRAVFSLTALAVAGVLAAALSGHLWGRYQEQTAALGFKGMDLASQIGSGANALWAFVQTELRPAPRGTQRIEAGSASPQPDVREAVMEE